MSVRSRKKKVVLVSPESVATVKSPDKSWVWSVSVGLFVLFAFGIILRLYHLNRNVFYFYDEGMYLNSGRVLLQPLIENLSSGTGAVFSNIGNWFSLAIQTDRPLWQLIVDARILLGATEVYWFSRGVSFVLGLATLGLLYQFAWRFSRSRVTATLSVVFLLFLPSHLLYSRSGLSESATTFFVLLGFYFYCFSRASRLWIFWAGIFFSCAFFTNYRLLVLPVLTFAAEILLSKIEQRAPDFRKWGWTVALFTGLILLACLDSKGQYYTVTSGWMGRQVGLAFENFSWTNLFTYPYIIFRLESWAFGLLFWGGAYFSWKKDWLRSFPFLLVCLWLMMFSFSSDKAARYMSAVLPFMALSAAVFVAKGLEPGVDRFYRRVIIGLAVVAVGTMAFKSFQLATNKASHKALHTFLKNSDRQARVVSTQPMVLGLDYDDIHQVISCPGVKDPTFLRLPENGFRFLVIGPQAYVSWTESGVSFDGDLGGFLNFFDKRVKPIKVFPHMNKAMLERFVFEHNQNLISSIEFLRKANDHSGDRRVYDVPQGLELMRALMSAKSVSRKEGDPAN